MKNRRDGMPWCDQYSHLSILIISSTNLPRVLQDAIGDSLLATIKRYVYFLQKYSGSRRVEIKLFWPIYLANKQKERWRNASPKLHKAYGLIMILPPAVLHYLDKRAGDLTDFMCGQILYGEINVLSCKREIEQSLNISQDRLMQLPNCSVDMPAALSDNLDVADFIPDEVLLSFTS